MSRGGEVTTMFGIAVAGFRFTNLCQSMLDSNKHKRFSDFWSVHCHLTVLHFVWYACVLLKLKALTIHVNILHMDACVSACACVYLRRASFHVKLSGDDALLVENSRHLVHLTTLHCLHQPIIILVPVCVLSMMIANYQTFLTKQLCISPRLYLV